MRYSENLQLLERLASVENRVKSDYVMLIKSLSKGSAKANCTSCAEPSDLFAASPLFWILAGKKLFENEGM
jgi:hypothetical protein